MMGFGLMGLGMLFMMAFWVGVILLAVWAVREFGPRREASRELDTPLEIARARYARGEITKKEFEQLSEDLA